MNNTKKISQLKIIAQPNGCGKVCIANLVHNFTKWSLHTKRWYAKLLMQMISWSFFLYFFFHWFRYQWIENNMNVFDSWKIVDFVCFNSNSWSLILITFLPFLSILWIFGFFSPYGFLGSFSLPSDGFISFWLSFVSISSLFLSSLSRLSFLLNTHTHIQLNYQDN